jgi:hypothetical protein
MKNKKFLLYPIILVFILFLIDKIFLLDTVKSFIKSDFTYIYYESREKLFDDLKKRKSDKKLMIILGSSRLLYFDHQELVDFYPDWDIYNFSSAVTTPAYYYYFLEKILNAGIKIDYLLLESDPNQFNLNSPVFKNSNLTYSFSPMFILRHAPLFGKDLLSFYFGKYLFAVGKNKPHLDIAYKRLTNPTMQALAKEGYKLGDILVANKGHAKSIIEDYTEKDFGVLEATSERTISWLFSNYKPSLMQYTFYEKILSELQKNKIPTLIVWPQSSIPMNDFMKKSSETKNSVDSWKEKIDSINLKYKQKLYDLSESTEYYCNSFVDGGHISKDCYRPLIRFVMSKYLLISNQEE